MRSHQALPVLAAAAMGVLLAGCSGSASTGGAGPVPLRDAVATLQPAPVWRHFYELTRIPRPSHHEAEAAAYVADLGRTLGLETIVDATGNVLIREPATAGREGRATVVLQAHLDMVAQPSDGSVDFLTTPIDAWVGSDGWVFAAGTSLGADDGIGVALVLAVLESGELAHGPIEALFTLNEEDGMDGINGLSPDALQGRLYVNVDNEQEGAFVISSAGAVDVDVAAAYAEEATPPGTAGFQVTVDGLIGGHSGLDIDKGRGSAHQLIARLLVEAPAELGARVARVTGGNRYNAIPSEATATVAVPAAKAEAFRSHVAGFDATVRGELAATDGDVRVTATAAELPPEVMEAAAQAALIGAVHAVPQGVYRMSADVPGLVETSNNLGVLAVGAGRLTAGAKTRSAVDAERDAHAQRVVDVFQQAGATCALGGAYSSWPPNPDSPLLALMQQVYQRTFGEAPTVGAVHAGLETGVTGVTYPDMDMISVGATTRDVHSVDERLEVASVPRAYDLLAATLAAIE